MEPPPGRREIGPDTRLHVRCSAAVDPTSVTEDAIQVIDLRTGFRLQGTVTLEEDGREVIFTPGGGFPERGMYEVFLDSSLRSVEGGELDTTGDEGLRFPIYYSTFVDPPRLVGSIRVRVDSPSAIGLDWDDAVDSGTPAAELVYEVFAALAGSSIDPNQPPQSRTAPGITEDVVSGLLPDTEYDLVVRAVDSLGNPSLLSAAVRGRTQPAADDSPPSFAGIEGLLADPASPRELTAHWQPASDTRTAPQDIRYNVYVALESGAQDFQAPALTSSPGATEAVIGGLLSDVPYFVVVRAVDTDGKEETNKLELQTRTPVSFSSIVFPIITLPVGGGFDSCWPAGPTRVTGGCARSDCHSASRRAGGVSLANYAGFLAPSTVSRRPPVVPGNPGASTLLVRMRRAPGTGGFMPRGATAAVSAECIASIDRWIAQGALDN